MHSACVMHTVYVMHNEYAMHSVCVLHNEYAMHNVCAMHSACVMHSTCAMHSKLLCSCISILLQIKIKGDALYFMLRSDQCSTQ